MEGLAQLAQVQGQGFESLVGWRQFGLFFHTVAIVHLAGTECKLSCNFRVYVWSIVCEPLLQTDQKWSMYATQRKWSKKLPIQNYCNFQDNLYFSLTFI